MINLYIDLLEKFQIENLDKQVHYLILLLNYSYRHLLSQFMYAIAYTSNYYKRFLNNNHS